MWRRVDQRPLSQVWWPPANTDHDHQSVALYNLSVLVKTNDFSKATSEIKVEIVADSDKEITVVERIVELTTKRSNWHPPLSLYCTSNIFTFVGSTGHISLLPNTNYTAKYVLIALAF